MKKIFYAIMFLLVVGLAYANPLLNPNIDRSVAEGDTLAFNITNSAPDNGDSAYSIDPNLAWVSVTKLTNTRAQVELTPGFNDAGAHDVTFIVADADSDNNDTITITVTNTNRAPSLSLPTASMVSGEVGDVNLSTSASDDDNDSLTWSVTAENTAEVDCSTAGDGVITLSADPAFTGTANCTLEVTDGTDTASDDLIITVAAENPSVSIGTVDFGTVSQGETRTKSFTVTNNGNVELTGIDLSHSSSENLTFTSKPTSLAVGASDTVIAQIIVADDASPGDFTVPVTFESNKLNKTFNVEGMVEGRLRISDLDVSVDDEEDTGLSDGETISDEAEPGSTVTFDLEIENTFNDNDEDIDIEDIEVTITIFDVDDGDDLDEESDEFDIKADDTEDVSLEFDIPDDADEDTYDVLIEIVGTDENDVRHEVEWNLQLEVEKEKHKISIKRASLNPSTVSCNRFAQLDVRVQNVGQEEEDEVVIAIESPILGINIHDPVPEELDNDIDDDDSDFEKVYSLDIDKDERQGTYTIDVRAYYDFNKVTDFQRVELTVQNCGFDEEEEEQEQEEEEEEVVVIQPPVEDEEDEPVVVEGQPDNDYTGSSGYLALLILAYVVVAAVIIALIVYAFKK